MLWRNQIWIYPPKFSAQLRGDRESIRREKIIHYLKPNLSNCKVKIAQKIFLNRYRTTVSLTFNLDDLRALLVSPSYFSSDDPMEIDSISAAGSDDSDIQVIACYREQPAFSETSAAGRQMTIDTTQCLGDDSSSLWPGDEFIQQLLRADYDYSVMGAGPQPVTIPTDMRLVNVRGCILFLIRLYHPPYTKEGQITHDVNTLV